MEELIKQIIEIEDKAQSVVRDAREASGELAARISRDSKKMQGDIEKQTQEKNDSLRRMEEDEVQQKLSAINEQAEKTLLSLEEKYRDNKDKWVEQIVNGVIGG